MYKKGITGQIILHIFFILLSLAYILPFLLLISISLSSDQAIKEFGYTILPKAIDFSAYKMIFKSPDTILNAYKVTIAFSLVTMVLSVLVMMMAAYPLSRSNCVFKKPLSYYIFFTMIFSGGMIPSYIINSKYLHLNDTMLIYILPSLVNAWNVIIIRTFFQGLPNGLVEAAKIDGAGEIYIFARIIIPLSKPVIATMCFLTLLAKWNDWNTSLIYIRNEKLYSLQYLLQRILREVEFVKNSVSQGNDLISIENLPAESVRYAMALVAAGPMLVMFPFFQKYFARGLTVGAIKG
jgi:putative aldouronate transport system permease protein